MAIYLLFISVQAGIPCTIAGTPSGCDNTRIVSCGTLSGYPVIPSGSNTLCSDTPNSFHRGDKYIVQFNQGKGGTCFEILMENGECWGTNPINNGEYNCQGRCGASCGGTLCSNWAHDCLKHDVCSWYFGASGGSGDANCGDEYAQATNDFLSNCLFNGKCTLASPSQSSSCCPSTANPLVGTCE
ncbi:hypothetical protein HDV01_003350 [Terramyces sp. JEL0728]|nr:hypothetical protein HDV01_003350 [Terramyces sp. JEL0728]